MLTKQEKGRLEEDLRTIKWALNELNQLRKMPEGTLRNKLLGELQSVIDYGPTASLADTVPSNQTDLLAYQDLITDVSDVLQLAQRWIISNTVIDEKGTSPLLSISRVLARLPKWDAPNGGSSPP